MISLIIEYISTIFYWFVGLVDNIINDVSMPKWVKVIILILFGSIVLTIGAALIKLVVGIGIVILAMVGVVVTIFFVVMLVYAMIELIKNNLK